MATPNLPLDDQPQMAGALRFATIRQRVEALDHQVRDLSHHLSQFGAELERLQHHAARETTSRRGGDLPGVIPAVDIGLPWCVIRLLGPVVVTGGEQAVDLSRRGKAESVLKALCLARERRVAPGLLAEWVWPGLEGQEARHNLQTTVSALRRCLHQIPGKRELIRFGSDAYHLDAEVVTDIDLFDHAYQRAIVLERRGDDDLARVELELALPLYRDDLDIDEFEDLCFLIERERLSGIYLTILSKLSALHYRGGRWEECIACATQLLSRDPSREDAHRLIIRSYLKLGQRAQGLRQYELCERIIRQHFDSAIEPETAELRAELLP